MVDGILPEPVERDPAATHDDQQQNEIGGISGQLANMISGLRAVCRVPPGVAPLSIAGHENLQRPPDPVPLVVADLLEKLDGESQRDRPVTEPFPVTIRDSA
ncbi:hypothetical protein GCM10022416_50290 [Actinomadura keratinilytica]|uniref:Uncharacterized protein n=1 Tax=Actinomadura keratinilytica TaxID=547461 RepID=A0ABP7ZB75_9ACTN